MLQPAETTTVSPRQTLISVPETSTRALLGLFSLLHPSCAGDAVSNESLVTVVELMLFVVKTDAGKRQQLVHAFV